TLTRDSSFFIVAKISNRTANLELNYHAMLPSYFFHKKSPAIYHRGAIKLTTEKLPAPYCLFLTPYSIYACFKPIGLFSDISMAFFTGLSVIANWITSIIFST